MSKTNSDPNDNFNKLVNQSKVEITHTLSSMVDRGLTLSNQISPVSNPFENIRVLYEFPGVKK